MTDKALLVIDVQNDFCKDGALEVNEGDAVVRPINLLMDKFEIVIATQDWHPLNHSSFASGHPGHKPMDIIDYNGTEQVLWPDHCVQGTHGARFHPDLQLNPVSLIVRKGFRKELDSYSAFFENDRKTPTGLEGYLKRIGISTIYICGLATDYCVFYSAEDALQTGFAVNLISDCCRAVGFPEGSTDRALNRITELGGSIITSTGVK